MSVTFDELAGDPGRPAGSPTAFGDFIEERYQEWESEFGEENYQRRKVTLDPE